MEHLLFGAIFIYNSFCHFYIGDQAELFWVGGSVVVDSLFIVASVILWGFVFGPCFVMQYLVSYLVFQSSPRGRECWLLYFNCVLAVVRLLVFCVSSLFCPGLVCDL